MNVSVYARYSSDNQSETSIEQQLKACYEYCKRNNYNVIAEYSDEAISGRTDDRPQFQKMIEDSKRKMFQGIVIYSVDRFSRSLYQSAIYANELDKSGISIISATEHISGDPSGKLTFHMLMAFAQYYSDELGQKVKRGMNYNAERGYSIGGTITLGYRTEFIDGVNKDGKKRLVADETAAPVIKRIFEMYADEGKTMAQICQHLNEQGIKTSKGAEFNKNSLRLMLRNKKYIGIHTYAGVEYPGNIPRIIDDELFERVQQALEMNKKAPAKNKAVGKDEYILTHRLFCGHCKATMIGWSGTGRWGKLHRYYVCNGKLKKSCDKRRVRKQVIEDAVIQQCRETLTDDNIERIANDVVAYNEAEQQNNVYLKNLEKQIAENDKQQTNLMSSLKLCEDDDLKRKILVELSHMDKQAKGLQTQLAIEESRKTKITRREIVFFLKDLQNGDISDMKYRKMLINVLVSRIHLYDDGRLTIIFYSGDKTISMDVNLIDDIEREINANCSGGGGYYTGDSPSPPYAAGRAGTPIYCYNPVTENVTGLILFHHPNRKQKHEMTKPFV